jgi:hypothetical protein
VDIGADAVDYKSVDSTWRHASNLNNVSQCHCEPGVSVWPRNRDAKAGGFGERNCGRDGVPQEARGAFRKHEQYGGASILTSVGANGPKQYRRTNEYKNLPGSLLRRSLALGSGKSYISGPSSSVNILLIRVLMGLCYTTHASSARPSYPSPETLLSSSLSLFDVIRISRYQRLSAPPLRFHPQQLVNLFYCATGGQCAQEFRHPCPPGASGGVNEGLTRINSTHHWKSMKCLMCFFATSKSTLPPGIVCIPPGIPKISAPGLG